MNISDKKNAPAFLNGEYTCNTFFEFNERMFNESTSLTKKTIDANIFVILSFDKDMIPKINENYILNKSFGDFALTNGLLNE